MLQSRTARIALAFAVVYLVWGSTYLAIRVGVLELPPVLFVSARFVVAGLLMLAFALARGAHWPATGRDWRNIALTGLMMLGGGNGLVTWSEQWVESNQAALMIATSALWMAGLGSLGQSGERVGGWTLAGLALGFGGVALLVGAGLQLRLAPPLAYLALIVAPMMWCAGSIHARRNPVGCPPLMTAALQMLITGVAAAPLAVLLGEPARWQWHPQATLALAYLIVFGSCIAYGTYFWLVHQVTPAQLGTYAYVNPAVAVLLGWWILGEQLAGMQIVGTVVILVAVVLVTFATRRAAR